MNRDLTNAERRWLREDAHRWIRPDAARFLKPVTDPVDVYPALSRKYRADQPRVPAGNPDGGRWTDDEDSGVASPRNLSRPMGRVAIDVRDEIGSLGLFSITPRERITKAFSSRAILRLSIPHPASGTITVRRWSRRRFRRRSRHQAGHT